MKVLVIDDSSTMRRIISNALKSFTKGIEIEEAENGAEGLEKANNEFDIILSDVNMPVMNGFDFLKQAIEKGITSPIVMITTEAEKTNVITAIKMGAKNYITKPFTPDTLKTKLENTLGSNL
jgi:two-component system chemotaxis response regulator CheY